MQDQIRELFEKDGKLMNAGEWEEKIKRLKPLKEHSLDEPTMIDALRTLMKDAVLDRIKDSENVAICFSGGLDSSYIAALCKANNIRFTCYTVGFQDGNFKEPEDVVEACKVAKILGLTEDEFKVKIFNIEEIEAIFEKTIKILKQASLDHNIDINNVVNVGVGSVELAVHSISNGEKTFFSGLGSEEIFAGYERHKNNPTNEECYHGLLRMYERDILRDASISSASGFRFRTPFLDERLIKYALAIPIEYKIGNAGSKLILRQAAEPLLGKASERVKRAAQYGSSFDRALSKIASKHGYKYKKDYIQSI